jgi:HD-like signal output (HDOD) protein
MKRIALADVAVGMVLDRDVVDKRGRLVVPAGVTITDRHVNAFKVWGITEIVITSDDDAPASVGIVDEAQLRAIAEQFDDLFKLTDKAHPAIVEIRKVCLLRRSKLVAAGIPLPKDPLADLPQDEPLPRSGDMRFRSGADWVKSLGSLPSLPDVYYRLTQIIDHPRSSAKDIARVIEDDAALTARLLRLVNSAFYGFPGKIEEVSRALSIIGTEEIKNLALATSVFTIFKNVPQGLITMKGFWSHSLACAIAGRLIASYRGETSLESIFVGGLLHDIGALILCVHRSKEVVQAARLARANSMPMSQAERQLFGYDHGTVAEVLLEAWNLPLRTRKIVANHDNPQRSSTFPLETSIVHLANIMVCGMQIGSSGENWVPPLVPQAWDALRLDADIFSRLAGDVDRVFAEVASVILKDDA